MEINPVIISVIVLCVLCLCKVNVMLSMLIACIVGGIVGGMSIENIFETLYNGFSSNAETALSYILLGAFATAMTCTGVSEIFSKKIVSLIKGNGKMLLFIFAGIACLSQNIIPIHIAFIPILIPPLLNIMNKLNIDRRGASCALAFGLEMPYIVVPLGFGLIFQGIVAKNLTENGMNVTVSDVTKINWILGVLMLVGLLIAILVSYKKPREYSNDKFDNLDIKDNKKIDSEQLKKEHYVSLLAIIATVIVQFIFKSLPLAALCGILVMIIFKSVRLKDVDKLFYGGIKQMGYIAFIMLIAGGYAMVLKECGGVDSLINSSIDLIGGNKLIAATIITLIGLFVTIGIGTSFGTVPILAVIYVPLCAKMGFSVNATMLLMSAAAALGDAGSPASDTTLGPTSGLNADGNHDHIWDTCVPTFLHYNIPIMLGAIIISQFI